VGSSGVTIWPTSTWGLHSCHDTGGCGYARESTQAVLEQGRKDFGFKRVAAMATPDNEKSIRLLESLGFERQGRIKMPGETTELELYGLDFSGDPRS
jgi:RimJ/RimL family protein N-acetyltransferase